MVRRNEASAGSEFGVWRYLVFSLRVSFVKIVGLRCFRPSMTPGVGLAGY